MGWMGGYSETFDKNKATRERVAKILKDENEKREEK
jgi:hypothetical protein